MSSSQRGRFSRRQFLAGAASAGAGAALTTALSGVVDRAYAVSESVGCRGDLSDIEHFVFVMQENRSFDHYFGTLSGVRGFDDPRALVRNVGGRPYNVFHQFGYQPAVGVTPHGYTLPFALRDDILHDDQYLNDPTHDWGPQHACWNGGRMDKWLTTHIAHDGAPNAPIVMSHYNRSTLRFYYELADAFTICDNYFCSVLGPTYPNRLYWMSGMLDPHGHAGGPMLQTLGSVLPDPTSWGYFKWKTMPEVLEEHGISWKVYTSTDAIEGAQGGLLMDNVLRLFKQYSTVGSTLNNKGLLPTIEANFIPDVLTGRLPQVSWIVTDFTQCEHPAGPPYMGMVVVAELIDLLASNPSLWAKTAIILSYDENGGFFDHVPPPVPPPGTPDEFITARPQTYSGNLDGFKGPIGLGFRVPCLVISPYSRGGLVYSGTLDHTSQLRLLESRFGTRVPNLSAWRRATVHDMTGAFDFAKAPDTSRSAVPLLPVPPPVSLVTGLVNALPGTLGKGLPYPYPPNSVPRQEPGKRRQPSGRVAGCAPSKSAVTAPTTTTPTTVAASAGATKSSQSGVGRTTSSGPAVAAVSTSAAATHIAATGAPLEQEVVRGAAMVALGGAVVALTNELSKTRREPNETEA